MVLPQMASVFTASEYLHIVPVRFTDAQLATVDEQASFVESLPLNIDPLKRPR